MEKETTGVPEKGKQGGETPKYGAEPEVWTPSMIRALEEGVKGGKWFSLIDKVGREKTLKRAWELVKRRRGSAGVDQETIQLFEKAEAENLQYLGQQIAEGKYRPLPVKRVEIPKGDGKTRPLGIPTVRDRVVQGALRLVIEPIFERDFSENSYGFRPGRRAHAALERVEQMLEQGNRYVVDADIKSYFDTIPHGVMMERVKEKVADGRVLELIEKYLEQKVLEDAREWSPTTGTPQGAVLSPLLANIYLHPLDKLMEERGDKMTRYADDFVIACKTVEEAEGALEAVKKWMNQSGLELSAEKTRIVDMTIDGSEFQFLGYRFERLKGKDYKFPRDKSLNRYREKLRELTYRTNGQCLKETIRRVNAVTKGWYRYFSRCWRTTFDAEDRFIRQRLRAILKKHAHCPGVPKGEDFHRWTNEFFAAQGLFSMTQAHAAASIGS